MSNQLKVQPKEISATDARNNFADIVNEVYYSGQEYLITRHDEPMVKLVRVDSSSEVGVGSSELGDGSLELGVRGGRQKNEPQRPKKIELDTDQFKRPAGLRKPGTEEAAATEEAATEEPEKELSEEEERLARIKARILKIYRG
jgi:prevent-host-death family protein